MPSTAPMSVLRLKERRSPPRLISWGDINPSSDASPEVTLMLPHPASPQVPPPAPPSSSTRCALTRSGPAVAGASTLDGPTAVADLLFKGSAHPTNRIEPITAKETTVRMSPVYCCNSHTSVNRQYHVR